MKYIILFILLTISTPFAIAAEDQQQNYCHDLESWKEREELVKKYPNDMDLQLIHAVRIGLCDKFLLFSNLIFIMVIGEIVMM